MVPAELFSPSASIEINRTECTVGHSAEMQGIKGTMDPQAKVLELKNIVDHRAEVLERLGLMG